MLFTLEVFILSKSILFKDEHPENIEFMLVIREVSKLLIFKVFNFLDFIIKNIYLS